MVRKRGQAKGEDPKTKNVARILSQMYLKSSNCKTVCNTENNHTNTTKLQNNSNRKTSLYSTCPNQISESSSPYSEIFSFATANNQMYVVSSN
jgi:hypothetical protein